MHFQRLFVVFVLFFFVLPHWGSASLIDNVGKYAFVVVPVTFVLGGIVLSTTSNRHFSPFNAPSTTASATVTAYPPTITPSPTYTYVPASFYRPVHHYYEHHLAPTPTPLIVHHYAFDTPPADKGSATTCNLASAPILTLFAALFIGMFVCFLAGYSRGRPNIRSNSNDIFVTDTDNTFISSEADASPTDSSKYGHNLVVVDMIFREIDLFTNEHEQLRSRIKHLSDSIFGLQVNAADHSHEMESVACVSR
ncbi:hypothetical protein GGI20_001619 [Coemansia sp. BCRC 34301]|nr:hypothetical protein GGI20_001619 [Coemansia sp. BCRC 34301]